MIQADTRALWALFLLGMVLAGCAAAGPDYIPPETRTSPAWNSSLSGGMNGRSPDPYLLAHWWTTLKDPELSSLILKAARNNLDLKNALARVREARARRGVSQAGEYPTVNASASLSTNKSSEDTGSGNENKLYSAGFDASWELDVFGGVRRSVEAAEANLQASREDVNDVLVSLLAEVALNYIDVRTYQARLAVAESNLASQQETFSIVQAQYQAGLTDDLSVQQARYNLENTRSGIPSLRTGLETALNRIAVLLGEQPGAVHNELSKPSPVPVPVPDVAVGVPADVLRRRPDIRKAERNLAAQTARIGVATADLYPKFTLTGSIGLDALSPESLFSLGNRTYGWGPRISLPIFDAGAIRQNIAVQSALQEQSLIQYETTVLKALEEVENAMVDYAQEQRRRQSLAEAASAAKLAAALAANKFQAGLTGFTSVLDAQRSLLNFQDQLAVSSGRVTGNLVRLYKTLGGGWESMPGVDTMSNEENRNKIE